MLAARLSGNSNYDNPRPTGRGLPHSSTPPSAKTSDPVAGIAGGSAGGVTAVLPRSTSLLPRGNQTIRRLPRPG